MNGWRKPETAPFGEDVLVVWKSIDTGVEIAVRSKDQEWLCFMGSKQIPLKWQPLPSIDGDPE